MSGSGDHIIPESANYRQGSDGDNCASCVFFSDGICDVYDAPVEASMTCDSHQDDDESHGDGDQGNGVGMSELYCADDHVVEDDGLIWKTVLRTGTWKYRPGPGQRPIPVPLSVVKGKSTNPQSVIGLQDIVDAWDNKAIEHATVPLTHADKTQENTGWVRKIKVDNDPDRTGHYVLKAGLEFTEPDIKQKILNKSIANTSVGLYYDYIRKDDGAKFPVALAHVALTNRPWINGMRPFGLSEEEAKEIKSFEFAEDMTDTNTATTTEIKLEGGVPTTGGTYMVPVTFTTTPNGSGTPDVTFSFAPREQWKQDSEEQVPQKPENKETQMSVIPGLEGLELSEEDAARVQAVLASAASEAQAAAEAAQAERDRLAAENLALSEKEREREVESRVDELKKLGLSEQPGFLKIVREVLLADDGSKTLELSEGNSKEELSFKDVVNKLIDALPKKDGKINFGEQAESLGTDGKPPENAIDENKTADEKYAEAYEYLHGVKPKTK